MRKDLSGRIAVYLKWKNFKKACSFLTILNRWGRIALYLGRDYPFQHTKSNFILKFTVYGPVKNMGVDPKGMREYTPNI